MAANPLDRATFMNTQKMTVLQAITELFVLSFGLCLICNFVIRLFLILFVLV